MPRYRFDILREEIDGFVSYRAHTSGGCSIWLPTCAPFAAAYPRAEVRPVDNMAVWDQCIATQGKRTLASLDFSTADFSNDSDPRFLVGTTQVTGNTVLKNCWYTWPAWRTDYSTAHTDAPSGQMYPRLQRGGPCRADDPVLKRLVASVRDAKAVEAPVTDLLYPWGSDDTVARGACRDAALDDCLPATPADVPEGPAALIERGEVDPSVLCAAAAPTVAEHFGAGFAPVTGDGVGVLEPDVSARACAFVEEQHGLQIEVQAVTRATTDEMSFVDDVVTTLLA